MIGIITNIEINNEKKNHILKNLNIIFLYYINFYFGKEISARKNATNLVSTINTIYDGHRKEKLEIKNFKEMRNFLRFNFFEFPFIYSLVDFFTLHNTWGTCLGRFI